MTDEIPVLIIGAGPVGLSLAGDLAWRGVRNVLVESRPDAVFQPKMDMVSIRSMEICRRWGIADEVRAAGYNREFTQDCAWVTDLQSYEFGREKFASPARLVAPPESPEHRERCPQNFFDPVLSRFARSTGLSDLRYNTTLLDFTQTPDGVTARVHDNTTNKTSTIHARYLIGCDGGDSKVRNDVGITMSGEGALTYTTNAIIHCPELHGANRLEPAYRYIFISEEGTWATLVAIDGYNNWRFSLIGDGTQRVVSAEEMGTEFLRAVGTEVAFEILSVLPWVRRQLVADSYRSGSVFLAGDSAHLTSPTGGFGMNTGILDAVNLSWKISAVLEGWADDALLDSYEFEQRPVAIRNVTEAGDNLRRMLAPRFTDPDPMMFREDSPRAKAERESFGTAYTEAMSKEWNTTGIHLGYVYEGSPVVISDGSAMPWPEVSTYTPTARPGSRAPHVWLDDEVSILDYFGRGFVLLRFSDAENVDGIVDVATETGVPLTVIDIRDDAAAARYESALVLVRPDGHVAWRSDQSPSDPRSVLSVVTGRQLASTGVAVTA